MLAKLGKKLTDFWTLQVTFFAPLGSFWLKCATIVYACNAKVVRTDVLEGGFFSTELESKLLSLESLELDQPLSSDLLKTEIDSLKIPGQAAVDKARKKELPGGNWAA